MSIVHYIKYAYSPNLILITGILIQIAISGEISEKFAPSTSQNRLEKKSQLVIGGRCSLALAPRPMRAPLRAHRNSEVNKTDRKTQAAPVLRRF
jgi:hypothetical protein